MFDVIIVGGGPAGMSAALILGRCRRKVLLCDAGEPRNAASHALHGFLTRDGIPPKEFLKIAREQLAQYTTVQLESIEVTDAVSRAPGFEVSLSDGRKVSCKKLLLATGVTDSLPEVRGTEKFYGRSIFHCPYCDGWEFSDKRIVAYGIDKRGQGLALKLLNWTSDVTLCTDGRAKLTLKQKAELSRKQIALNEKKLDRFEGTEGVLRRIIFDDGSTLDCDAVFFALDQHQRSHLPEKLGAEMTDKGNVKTGDYESTAVPGLFVAGDASEELQLVILAAAEGAKAAFAINTALQKEDKC